MTLRFDGDFQIETLFDGTTPLPNLTAWKPVIDAQSKFINLSCNPNSNTYFIKFSFKFTGIDPLIDVDSVSFYTYEYGPVSTLPQLTQEGQVYTYLLNEVPCGTQFYVTTELNSDELSDIILEVSTNKLYV